MPAKFPLPWTILALLLAALLPAAPAAAQVEPSGDNAITCALIYAYMGDTGPGYEALLARNAQATGRTLAQVREEMPVRMKRLTDALADGRLNTDSYDHLVSDVCPRTFGVAPGRLGLKGASAATATTASPTVDPVRCAGLARWFDHEYPSNVWGTTWAGDEMVRRAASAAGLSYGALDSRAGGFSPATGAVAPLLDEMVRCQNAYDTPVPPGAVIAAAQHGDRPGIERGRNNHCQALANDFDSKFPDIDQIERSIAWRPMDAMEPALKQMNALQWHFKEMDKAQCPSRFTQPRVERFEELSRRATAALNAAKSRLQREGPWW